MQINGTDLLKARLDALERESERVRALRTGMHMTADALFRELVEQGWRPPEAMAVMVVELGNAIDRIADGALS